MTEGEAPVVPKSKRYRKDKPWDNDPTIDKWKIHEIKPEESNTFLQESSFSVMFPQYREKYIKECYGLVKKRLMESGIKLELNLLEGSLIVRTTKKTWDPYAIIKARDVIKLLSRSVPYAQALRLMEDGIFCDVIKIRSLVRNTDRFIKRRQRLIGPNGATLKALELLTDCYILVQGGTVSLIGGHKNIKVLSRVIIDTMQNVHPIYHIKELMIKRQLMKDDTLKTESWDRFLPKFKQIKQKKKKSKKLKQKKEYDPFPPEQLPRKEDILMMSGEYFLGQKQKKQRALDRKRRKQQKKMLEKQQQNEADQEAPAVEQEIARQDTKKQVKFKEEDDIDQLKKKFLTQPVKKIHF